MRVHCIVLFVVCRIMSTLLVTQLSMHIYLSSELVALILPGMLDSYRSCHSWGIVGELDVVESDELLVA